MKIWFSCSRRWYFVFCVSIRGHLRDIYELALENDAQLKAEEAVYLAKRETET
jgi:hypothetical protein